MKRIGDYKEKSGYSVFENTNKELVEKIKAIKSKSSINVGDVVNHWRSGECKVVSFVNEREALVYSEKHKWHEVHQIDNAQEQLKDEHLQLINDTFKVEDYFTENFGIISSRGEIILGIKNVAPNHHRKESYDEVSVAALKKLRMNTSFYEGFKFECVDCYGSVNCFFDENGNYVNRDYNFDIEKYEVVEPMEYKQKQVDEFIKKVSESITLDNLYHLEGTDTWFSDRFAYILCIKEENREIYKNFKLYVNAKPKQGEGNTYYHRGCSSNSSKLSKACEKEVVTKEFFLARLKNDIETGIRLI